MLNRSGIGVCVYILGIDYDFIILGSYTFSSIFLMRNLRFRKHRSKPSLNLDVEVSMKPVYNGMPVKTKKAKKSK